MRSWSRKPRVMKSAVGSPLRSRSALVATVVPIFTASICLTGIASPCATPRKWRMPAIAASRYRPGFSESSLCVASVPSGLSATMSVKVPPRSIQNCHFPAVEVMGLPVLPNTWGIAKYEMNVIATAWSQLRDQTHITVIRSDAEYNRMSRLLDMLVDEVGDGESHALASLAELVGNLVEQYEASEV